LLVTKVDRGKKDDSSLQKYTKRNLNQKSWNGIKKKMPDETCLRKRERERERERETLNNYLCSEMARREEMRKQAIIKTQIYRTKFSQNVGSTISNLFETVSLTVFFLKIFCPQMMKKRYIIENREIYLRTSTNFFSFSVFSFHFVSH